MCKKNNCFILIFLLISIFILSGCGDDEYSLNLTVEGRGTITLNGKDFENSTSVIFEENEVVSVSSVANNDWEFDQYTGDLTGTSSSQKLTMNSDKQVTAIFSLKGSVSVNGYVKDTDKNPVYNVRITSGAEPNNVTTTTNSAGYYFLNNVPVNNNYFTLTLNKVGFWDESQTLKKEKGSQTIDPITLYRKYYLIVQNDFFNAGSTSPSPEKISDQYKENSVQTLVAIHSNQLTFDKWTGDIPTYVDAYSTSMSITMDKNRTIRAEFIEITKYSLHVHCNNDNYGSISQSPEGMTHIYNTEIKLSNTPEEGYNFSHWVDQDGQIYDSTTVSFFINENSEYTCVFDKRLYQLTVEVNEGGMCFPEFESKQYLYETSVTLTAIEAEGWIFRQWQGSITSLDHQITFVMDTDKTLIPLFERPFAKFQGQVKDMNGIPLDNVKVIAGRQSTYTNENGLYFLNKASIPLNTDQMVVLFQKQGYCLYSETHAASDQSEIKVYPKLSQTCDMLKSVLHALQILSGQPSSEVLTLDIDANNQPNLSEIIFMLQHLAE